MLIGEVGDSKIDNLHRIVAHYKYIARLEISMNKTLLVSCLQATAHLPNYLNRPLHRKPWAISFDQLLKCFAP